MMTEVQALNRITEMLDTDRIARERGNPRFHIEERNALLELRTATVWRRLEKLLGRSSANANKRGDPKCPNKSIAAKSGGSTAGSGRRKRNSSARPPAS